MPICPLRPSSRFGPDVVCLYVTALVYVVFDLFVFHMLSAWLTMALELVEIVPVVLAAWFYSRSRARGAGGGAGFPKQLYIPLISTGVQLQLLVMAGLYRLIDLT